MKTETQNSKAVAIIYEMDGVDVIKINGMLTWDTVECVRRALEVTAQSGNRELALDLSGMDFIDSKGVGFLVQIRSCYGGGEIALAAIQDGVKNVLERTFVLEKFTIYKSVSEIAAKDEATAVV